MRRPLDDAEFVRLLRAFDHTAFRLELQPAYNVGHEGPMVEAFVAGQPQRPTGPESRAWYSQIAKQTQEGKRVGRVRVHETPPNDYQRWLRSVGAWNNEAGEKIRYMSRERAHEVGLLPAAKDYDCWLLDSNKLIIFSFDGQGRRVGLELVTDPAEVVKVCAWRDLAIHHSELDETLPPTEPMGESEPA